MQTEKGPRFGECDRCKRRNQLRLPKDFCLCAASHTRPRSRSAFGSSKPDENQWRSSHACLCAKRRSRSQRHSVTLCSDGIIAIRRNGSSRRSGNAANPMAISSSEDFAANALTTWPRLAIERTGCWSILCQLTNARHTPASLAAIHVPPSGSCGKIARRSARSIIAGGSAVERVNFSSRFIAR